MSVSGSSDDHLLSEKEFSDEYQSVESEKFLLAHPIAAKDKLRRARQNITLYLGLVFLLLNALWSVYLAVGYAGSGKGATRPSLIYCMYQTSCQEFSLTVVDQRRHKRLSRMKQ